MNEKKEQQQQPEGYGSVAQTGVKKQTGKKYMCWVGIGIVMIIAVIIIFLLTL